MLAPLVAVLVVLLTASAPVAAQPRPASVGAGTDQPGVEDPEGAGGEATGATDAEDPASPRDPASGEERSDGGDLSPAEGYTRLLGQLTRDLEQLDADIAAALARQADLRQEGARLEGEAAATGEAIDDARTRISTLEAILRDRIAGAYMAEGADVATLDPTVDEGLIRRIYAEARSETDDRLAGRLASQQDRLEREQDDLADLDEAVDGQASRLDELLDDLRDQRAERTETAARLERAIEEAQRRALVEAAASQRRAEAAAEVARLAQVAAAEAVAQDAADVQVVLDAAHEAQEAAEEAAREAGATVPGTAVAPGGITLCHVGGITVSCLIDDALGEMILAAAADGVTLAGSGYRSTQRQIELRAVHCRGDVYGRPAGACSPPTARPGSSMHEVGLAIDFAACASRSTACWTWLDGHAADHGFSNLPSEPWHWSIDGT